MSEIQLEKSILEISNALQLQSEAIRDIATSVQSLQSIMTPTEDPGTECPSQTDGRGEWEQIRSAVLKEYSGDSPPDSRATPAADGASDLSGSREAESSSVCPNQFQSRISDLTSPDEIQEEDLRDALLARDELLDEIHKQLPPTKPLTPQELSDVSSLLPEELQARVEFSLEALDQQIRVGELELSLERARIGRQITSLEETRETLQTAARSFGLQLNEDGSLEGEVRVPKKGSRGRRWLGAMGFGN